MLGAYLENLERGNGIIFSINCGAWFICIIRLFLFWNLFYYKLEFNVVYYFYLVDDGSGIIVCCCWYFLDLNEDRRELYNFG